MMIKTPEKKNKMSDLLKGKTLVAFCFCCLLFTICPTLAKGTTTGRQIVQLVERTDSDLQQDSQFMSVRERFGRRSKGSNKEFDDTIMKRPSREERQSFRQRILDRRNQEAITSSTNNLQGATVTASSLKVPSKNVDSAVTIVKNEAAIGTPDSQNMLNLDFRDTDIKTIINFLSEQTKTNYLYDESLKGKVTLIGPQEVPLEEAVWLLESLLEFKGFTVVKVGDFKKVIPLAKAQGEKIETRLTYEENDASEMSENKEITQLIKLEYTNAEDIKGAIAGLLAKPNSVITYAHTNTLIVTENALNIRRIVSIIKELDVPVFGKKIHMVPLKFTQATPLATELSALIKQKAEEKVNPDTRQEKISTPTIMAEERTNSIILICLDHDYQRLRDLIGSFDQDISALPTMKIIKVNNAEAELIAGTIKEMLKAGGEKTANSISISADKRTNSIILSSMSYQLLKRAAEIVTKLDGEVIPEQKVLVMVHKLEFAEAEKVAALLNGFSFVPIEELKEAKVGETKQQTQNAGEVIITPDPATNSLIVTTPKHRWPHILKVIEQLDIVRPQVMVEVLIVEIAISRAKQLGIDFNLMDQEGEGNRPFAVGNADNLENFVSPSGIANGLSLGILTGGAFDLGAAAAGDVGELSQIGLLIRAMQNDTNANILSSPTILTSDNEPARISVGEQIQLPSSFNTAANTGLNTITNYSTEDLGVILELTPRITKDEHVLLKINQTIKTRTNDTLYTENVPVISKREVDTSVTVLNNTTIALGGIISEEETMERTKIPILSDLPGIGKLFRNKKSKTKKINLMIFLTPHIIRCQEDADRISRMQRATIRNTIVEDEKKGTTKTLSNKLEELSITEEQIQSPGRKIELGTASGAVNVLPAETSLQLRARQTMNQFRQQSSQW
jgi:general secretion pathway protein D